MTFDDVLEQVRAWLGTEITLVLWLNEFGPADGWLVDTGGPLARLDDPDPDIHQPVHYVRFESGHGFALERTWFRSAQWKLVAGERSLDVDFGAITVSMAPATA